MQKNLNLKSVSAWITKSSPDGISTYITGYYKSAIAAQKAAVGSGWYGSDSEVESTTLYESEDGIIYEVKKIGKFNDVDKAYKEKMMTSIRSKLTQEEREFIKIEKK